MGSRGAPDDTFYFSAAGGVSGNSDGGAGSNTLDYSARFAFLGGVTVNLATGTATAAGHVFNIDNVIGTAVGDNLTGDAGSAIL